jgi:hypothetical protein
MIVLLLTISSHFPAFILLPFHLFVSVGQPDLYGTSASRKVTTTRSSRHYYANREVATLMSLFGMGFKNRDGKVD